MELLDISSSELLDIISFEKQGVNDIQRKKKIKIKYDESRERPYDVNRLNCNNKKAKKILKWSPKTSMDKGLSQTFSWATKNKISFVAPFKRWYYKKT